MALKLTCPACASIFGLPENARGTKAFCPKCAASLSVTSAGVAQEDESLRPALARPKSARRWSPFWLLLAIPVLLVLFLPCGLAEWLYLTMLGHTDEQKQVAKNDGDKLPPAPPGNTQPEKPADKTPVKPIQITPVKPVDKTPEKPAGKTPGEPVKGDTRMVDGLKVTKLTLPSQGLLPCLLWADAEGSAFLALSGDTGVLKRISFPDCKVTISKELDGKFTWMALSTEGLLLSDPGSERIMLVDPDTLKVKTEIAVPKLKRAASAPGLSWAVACDQGPFQTQKLYVVDLVKKTTSLCAIPQGQWVRGNDIGVNNPAVTPDGAYVFTQGDNRADYGIDPAPPLTDVNPGLVRFSFKDGKLRLEERDIAHSTRRGIGIFAGITISPDSKLVCLTWMPAPERMSPTTTIYPVDALKKQYSTLDQGVFTTQVGFDFKGGYVYGQNTGHDLVLFTPHGAKRKEYTLEKPAQPVTMTTAM